MLWRIYAKSTWCRSAHKLDTSLEDYHSLSEIQSNRIHVSIFKALHDPGHLFDNLVSDSQDLRYHLPALLQMVLSPELPGAQNLDTTLKDTLRIVTGYLKPTRIMFIHVRIYKDCGITWPRPLHRKTCFRLPRYKMSTHSGFTISADDTTSLDLPNSGPEWHSN